MEKKLGMALVGLGFIGQFHAQIISENPHAKLVAVCDLREDLAKSFAEKYGCDYYTNLDEMLKRDDIDAVDLCVQEDYHLEPSLAIAKAKKHLFIEKPIAKTVAEGKAILDACKENGVRCMVAHVLKFDPRYAQLKDAIRNGELGDITSMYFRRGNPNATAKRLNGTVSFFYYLGIHDLEMMMDYHEGAKPVKVYAQASNKINGHMNGDLDTAFVIITFDDGSVGNFQVSWAYPANPAKGIYCTAEVIGTKGYGRIDIDNQGLMVMTEQNIFYPDTLHWPSYNGKTQGDLPAQIEHYVQATLSGADYLVPDQSVMRAVAVAEAAQESIKTGKVIDISCD